MKYGKRNLFRAGLSAALLSACVLTSGTVHAASVPSVQELLTASENAVSDLTQGRLRAAGDLSAGFTAGTGETQIPVGVSAGTDLQAAYSLNPLMLELSGQGSLSMPGTGFDGALHLYLTENEDGSGGVYFCFDTAGSAAQTDAAGDQEAGTEAGLLPEGMTEGELSENTGENWTYAQIPAQQMDAVRQALSRIQAGEENLLSSAAGLLEGVSTLSEELVEVGGKTCYEIRSLPGVSQLEALAGLVQEKLFPDQAMNNFQSKLLQDICGILKLDCVLDIDSDTFLPVRLLLDTAGTDFTGLAEKLPGLLTGGQISIQNGEGDNSGSGIVFQLAKGITDLKLEIFFDCGESAAIVLPEKALEARAAYLQNAMSDMPSTEPLMVAEFGTEP